MSGFITILCSFPSQDEAKRISESVLQKRLAACVHMFPAGQSLYWWKGKIEDANEVYALFKTTRGQFAAIEKEIKAAHSYDVPCIIALPIDAGHAPYLDWLKAEAAQ